MLKYFIFIICLLLCFILGLFFCNIKTSLFKEKPIVIHDTTLVQRWETKIARDTVIKFLDKIVLKEVPAKSVTYQKVDTIFIKKIEKLNTFIDVNKTGDSLQVLTINIDKSMAKEYTFPSSLPEFRLIAKNDDVFYAEKRNIIEFDGLKFGVGLDYNQQEINKKYYLELLSGITLLSKLNVIFFVNTKIDAGVKIYFKL